MDKPGFPYQWEEWVTKEWDKAEEGLNVLDTLIVLMLFKQKFVIYVMTDKQLSDKG